MQVKSLIQNPKPKCPLANTWAMPTLRPFQMADMDQIMFQVAHMFDQVNPPDFYFLLHKHWPEGFLVLEDGGRILGFVLGNLVSAEKARILIMGVVDGERGKGYGSLILDEFLIRCRAMGKKVLALEVRMSNVKAQKFYLDRGYETTGMQKQFYQDGEDAYLMEKEI